MRLVPLTIKKNYLVIFTILIIAILPSFSIMKAPLEVRYFSRYIFWFAFFPISIISTLVSTEYRINDIFLYKRREIIAYQNFFQTISLQMLLWGIWVFLTFIGASVHFDINGLEILNLISKSIYILLDQILLASVSLIVYFASNNKNIAFFGAFILCSISFLLNVNHYFSLIFDFINPMTMMIAIAHFLILIGLIFMFFNVLRVLILWRDF